MTEEKKIDEIKGDEEKENLVPTIDSLREFENLAKIVNQAEGEEKLDLGLQYIALFNEGVRKVGETLKKIKEGDTTAYPKLYEILNDFNLSKFDMDALEGQEKYKKALAEQINELDEALEIAASSIFDVISMIEEDEALNKESPKTIPKTRFPSHYMFAKDKISNILFEGGMTEDLRAYKMEAPNSKKEITASAMIEIDKLEGVELQGADIDGYDERVHNAIVSLVQSGNMQFTELMIYKVMTGNPNAKFSKSGKNREDLLNSLNKLSMIKAHIEAEDEFKLEGYSLSQPIYSERLINYRSVSGILPNGQPGEAIELLSVPVLYRYASGKNQVSRISMGIVNTPITKSKKNLQLQNYLEKRISYIESTKYKIRYETVYKNLKIEAASGNALRQQKHSIRQAMKRILDYWTEEGYIGGYYEYPKGQQIKQGVRIIENKRS